MRTGKTKPEEGVSITNAGPAWIGWLFFLIGFSYLSYVYGSGFRPQHQADGWKLFDRPDDTDVWVGTALAVVCFSGAGAALLAHRAVWVQSRSWPPKLKHNSPGKPWLWQPDWAVREIMPDRPGGRGYFVAWGFCVC